MTVFVEVEAKLILERDIEVEADDTNDALVIVEVEAKLLLEGNTDIEFEPDNEVKTIELGCDVETKMIPEEDITEANKRNEEDTVNDEVSQNDSELNNHQIDLCEGRGDNYNARESVITKVTSSSDEQNLEANEEVE